MFLFIVTLPHHINFQTSQCLGAWQQLAAAASRTRLHNTQTLFQLTSLQDRLWHTALLDPPLLLSAKHVRAACCVHCFSIIKFSSQSPAHIL